MRRLLVGVVAASLMLVGIAGPATARPGNAGPPTIASVATQTDDLSLLVTALDCADLVGAVASPRDNLTVFAPTNEAFLDLLGFDSVEDLVAAVNAGFNGDACAAVATILGGGDEEAGAAALTKVLLYHVVPGRYVEQRVVRTDSLPTLNGEPIVVAETFGGDDAVGLVATNIQTSNGVVHVIDEVLLP